MDARAPDDPGLSVEQWAAGVKALPGRFASIFQRVPKQDGDGAREPDEIRTADGQKVATGARKKKRRRGKRRQATLWQSAKESMRQTVHEVVKEEVKDTPVGSAVDAAKKAGDKVKEGAAVVKEGAGVVAERAVKAGAQVGGKAKSLLNRILEAVEANPAPNADPEAEALAEREHELARDFETSAPSAPSAPSAGETADPVRSPEIGGAPEEHQPASPGFGGGASIAPAPAREGASAPTAEGVDVAEVGRKLKSGLSAVGDWLQGPGAPGYTSKRARPVPGGGDVVEARDAGAESVAPSAAPAPAPSQEASAQGASVQAGSAQAGSAQDAPVQVQQVGEDQGGDQDHPEDDHGAERRRDEAGE